MEIPYFDNPGVRLTVTVKLQHSSDVLLVDQANFNARNQGRDYTYFGGYYEKTPVKINVTGSGRWYLIVENDSGESYQYAWS